MRYRLSALVLLFLIPFNGFYLTKFGISPVYIFFSIGLYLFLISLMLGTKIRISIIHHFCILLLLYFASLQILFFRPNISAYIGLIFSLIYFIVSYLILSKVETKLIINMSEKMIFFSIPLLIYEAYYRITNPVYFVDFAAKGKENLFFYYYKINSIMYQDSNFVGLYVNSLFFFLLYLREYTNKKYYISLVILVVLTFTTISRASILTLVLFIILYNLKHKIYKYRFFILLFLIILGPILYFILKNYKGIDDSFSTKFMIIEKTIDYLSNASLINLLFGIGLGNTSKVLDIGAHNFFITYLIESGIIGLSIIVLFWLYILLKTKYKAGIIIFPFIFNGMSLTAHAIPYLYVIFAIILTIESRRKINAKKVSVCYNTGL